MAGSVLCRSPCSPATEAMLMIRPPRPCSTITRQTAWASSQAPVRLTSRTYCQRSGGISSVGAPQLTPALLTRMSIWPKAVRVAATRFATAAGSLTLPAKGSTSMPRPRR